ncbi:hypothetical protein [Lutibacter sp.]
MKKTITLLVTIATMLTSICWAQAPQKMSYQAIVRNASNTLVTNATVGMQISILQTTSTGTAVYVETQTPATNANGLVSIEIGTGTVVSGTFSAIDWSAGPYFIKIETDPGGGTNYTITGTSQLLSVPYALYAKTAESVLGVNIIQVSLTVNSSGSGITPVPFNETLFSKGTELVLNADGTISGLKAGKTYKITAHISGRGTSTGGDYIYNIYDYTSTVAIGEPIQLFPNSYVYTYSQKPSGVSYITPAVDTIVGLTSSAAIGTYTTFTVEEVH